VSLSIFSPAPKPANEHARQRAVDASGVRCAPPDPALHQIVARIAKLLGAPMAALSIIDRDRMWFAVRIGIDTPETSRAISFCAHAILDPGQPLIVWDTFADERFEGNPFVQNEPGVRFYIGVPVLDTDGHPLGTICAFDTKPRYGPLPLAALEKLAERAASALAEIKRNAGAD